MSDIKTCFKSRWGDGGLLVEVDFSQLEIVALAILSNDPVLKDDIITGRDMHTVRAAELFEVPEDKVTKSQRTLAKRLSFQLQYGAGAPSLAKKNGIPKVTAERFIESYYARYKRVKEWQDEIAKEVTASRVPTDRHTPKGMPSGMGQHVSATGRIYRFFEYDAPEWKRDGMPSFSPTEMKNYPIQGFATGDVMALFRGLVFRRIFAEELQSVYLMVNTVHDSVMFDVRADVGVGRLKTICLDTAASLPEEIEKRWDIKIDLPFNITFKFGLTWADL
jgi:DNA polymerase-1